MHQSYSTAALEQLHATIPDPNGTHACLTLYDVCPHTFHSTTSSRCRDPYLHCDLPSLPSDSRPRTIEYIDKDGRRIVETRRTTISPHSGPRSTQALEHIDSKARDVYSTARNALNSVHRPKEKAIAASLAPLVLSKHSPVMHHIRASTAAPPPRSILKQTSSIPTRMPIIYLVTFSTDRTPTTQAFAKLLNEHLPPRVPLRYTIDAREFLVPSRQIQEAYSGVAEITQHLVLRDASARREIDHAVDELMGFVMSGGQETSIAVCCTAGTHRSVAIAELIAEDVRREVRRAGTGEGVKIVVRHVHRVKGPQDPY